MSISLPKFIRGSQIALPIPQYPVAGARWLMSNASLPPPPLSSTMQSSAPATGALQASLAAADSAQALARSWNVMGEAPTLMLAFGKSSLEMARAATMLFDSPPVETIVLAVPDRIARRGASDGIGSAGRVLILPADHPLPTERSVHAAAIVRDAVVSFAREHGERGRIIALISGGGSAHLSLPAGELALDDLARLNRLLQQAGCSIHELNAVRKHTEQLKGGLLARLAGACSVHAFVASDVMGDPLDVIASGPCAPDPTTYGEALAIIDRYLLAGQLPGVAAHLRAGAAGHHAETLKPNEARANVHHTIITSNAVALDAAAQSLKGSGYHIASVTQAMQSLHAKEVGETLAAGAINIVQSCVRGEQSRVAILWGGEPVVDIRGVERSNTGATALGGPSQELALAAAIAMHQAMPLLREHNARVTIAAFSTDGIDGPTPAGGGYLTHDMVEHLPIDEARDALARHDSHSFLGAQRGLLTTGPTGVNVNHIAMILIDR